METCVEVCVRVCVCVYMCVYVCMCVVTMHGGRVNGTAPKSHLEESTLLKVCAHPGGERHTQGEKHTRG